MKKVLPLFISIFIAQFAGIIGSFFTANSVNTWYIELAKPEWNPPNWIFGPVWITLYTLMGIAAYLIWKNRKSSGTKLALSIYGVQLVLNSIWSIIFFGFKNPMFAFFEIFILLISIMLTICLFWKIKPLAGALLLPYLAWVYFAAYLNYAIWNLN